MPRLFVCHSSKDNVETLAFISWLMTNGWSKDDIFVDLHAIGVGERWRNTLRKANSSCEAVILLASPEALESKECQREINLAEDLGKEIIVALLRGMAKDDARLTRYADRQFVELTALPIEPMQPVEYHGRMHTVAFHLPALESIKARLTHLGIAPDSFSWAPKSRAGPYPGLSAYQEDDAGIFFGRDADIMAGVTDLRVLRKRRTPRLFAIVAASGAGKSSYLRAGLWPRLSRDPDFAPLAILRPAQGILTGPDGIGRQLAIWFERHGSKKLPGDIHADLLKRSLDLSARALATLFEEATELATQVRRAGTPDARSPAPLLAVDQGEELFSAENAAESERFLILLAQFLRSLPADIDPYILLTIRADSVELLLQRWPNLGLDTPHSRYLPPLSPSAYREVIIKPAQVYSGRVRRLAIEPALIDALIRDARGADALPLLSFTMQKLFTEFGADGNLTLARYDQIGGMGGSIDSALAEARTKAGQYGDAKTLRRLIIPNLATWDSLAEASKRIVSSESVLIGGRRAHLANLAHAMIEKRLLTRDRETIEVAHEVLLRRQPIAGWLEQQKGALKLRDDIIDESYEWSAGGKQSKDLVRQGERLREALELFDDEDYSAALALGKEYLMACKKHDSMTKRRTRRAQASIFALLISVIVALVGWMHQSTLQEWLNWYITMRPYMISNFLPYVLSSDAESALQPGQEFRECTRDCPSMVVLPAGKYIMGSPGLEPFRQDNEGPQQSITVMDRFAVSKYPITFSEWDVCVSTGGCSRIDDSGFGRKSRPVINITWDDAAQYVKWLVVMTGKPYRLLSESEWEYAARANATTAYWWGDEVGTARANCNKCGSSWDNRETSPVGSFDSNAFGLFDMHGNVWQWVQDCYYDNLEGIPSDAAARTTNMCNRRVVRGGSWGNSPGVLRASSRTWSSINNRDNNIGFRVARTLMP